VDLTDSHLHFDVFEREGVADSVIAAARAAGVTRLVAIGGDPAANATALSVARRHPGVVFPTAGYDRDLAGTAYDPAALRADAALAGVVAVGETGLDYFHRQDNRTEQIQLFRDNLEVALALDKPVVVHTRAADEDTLSVLGEYTARGLRGVIHCFTGGAEFAARCLDLGLYLGFSGIVTFANAEPLREVAAAAPADRYLVETDSPYLSPVPHRGKRCEPQYVADTAALIARRRGLSLAQLAVESTANAVRLFRLPTPVTA
jgi:TatD DNase family protein